MQSKLSSEAEVSAIAVVQQCFGLVNAGTCRCTSRIARRSRIDLTKLYGGFVLVFVSFSFTRGEKESKIAQRKTRCDATPSQVQATSPQSAYDAETTWKEVELLGVK